MELIIFLVAAAAAVGWLRHKYVIVPMGSRLKKAKSSSTDVVRIYHLSEINSASESISDNLEVEVIVAPKRNVA